ncbi:helix-turn-helix domain-containing protein [Salibacterium qingdaonense]|uniref:Transcriptional regulator, contains XRE-family HTH domain n=1 Tax=Salibacterium qingdaonense TaxID=266892 RepID=A0A1I4QWB7_9BACI|nr:helix-turn-helix transcriptional regulator [Salibacterium qingdaonense]SFM44075.1 Transcriptional regulator, contains XRE-family HTH domain [Salibacterium qingdaonense]
MENVWPKRLRKSREAANLNQKEAAKKFDITNYQLSRYENGHSNPDPDLISKFADLYEVSADYLLGRTDDPTPEQPSIFFYGGEISEDEQEHLEEELRIYRKRKQQWLEQREKDKE